MCSFFFLSFHLKPIIWVLNQLLKSYRDPCFLECLSYTSYLLWASILVLYLKNSWVLASGLFFFPKVVWINLLLSMQICFQDIRAFIRMSETLSLQTSALGHRWQIFNKERASWSVSYVSGRRDWRFEGCCNKQSSLPLLSVGAKQCDGLGMRSVRWFNGRSKAAWGDGFNHICLLITLPSAALVLYWDINGSQLPPSSNMNNKPQNIIHSKHS